MSSDSELLSSYARDRNEAAFAELVRSHIDLVYSAAVRRVGGDPHAAAEITQEVFIAMARHAERLSRHPVLNAWLHASTRNAAANFLRREQRRERQKQQLRAMQEVPSSDTRAEEWETVRGVLDDALDGLGEIDRQAIVLRFFESRSFKEIGNILEVAEDSARMRVGRALDKLRAGLARRGIVSSATVLAGALSTHSVVAAPVGLAASVTATSISVAACAPAWSLIHLMSMTKLSATLTGLALIVGIGLIAYHRTPRTKSAAPPAATVADAAPRALDADRRATDLTALVNEAQRRARPSAATLEAEEKIAILRDVLARLPEQSIPELKLATNADWHVAVDGELVTTDDYRRALAKIRSLAQGRFGKLLQPALRAYLQANNRQFPTNTAQLQSFAGPEIEPAMLARYRIAPASENKRIRVGGDKIITQDALIDSEYDSHLVIGPNGFGARSSQQSSSARASALLIPVMKAYKEAKGRYFTDVSELVPFATTPAQQEAIQTLVRNKNAQR